MIVYQLLYILIFFLLIFLLLNLVIAPVFVRFLLHQPLYPGFIPVSEADIPYAGRSWFLETEEILKHLGFEKVGTYRFETTAQAVSFLEFYTHPEDPVSAMATGICTGEEDNLKFANLYLEMNTMFSNDYEFNTLNSDMPRPYPAAPEKLVFQLPGVRNPEMHYSIHKWFITNYTAGMTPKRMTRGKEMEEVAQAIRKEQKQLVEIGYIIENTTKNRYELTWKGAFLMTWKQVFPVKQFIHREMEKAEKDVLERYYESQGVRPGFDV